MENENKENEKKGEEDELQYELLKEDYPHYDLSFKIIVIGNAGVGKSCLSLQATKKRFENDHLNTVGMEYFTFIMRYKDKIIKLQIMDTCGQELYRSLIKSFYKSCALAIIVYSIAE